MEKVLETELFRTRGFRRYRCKVCGHYFWSLVERDVCCDAPCMPYSFIGQTVCKIVPTSLSDLRERYLRFFERRGHTRVRKYPVVAARWRQDVYLVGASIYVFQPWVTEGIVPPPANPLVISQPCIRLTDVDIVGRSGRHLTGFEMMAHHAFNYPDRHVYWINETVELAHEFFTRELGIPEEEIVYKESTWSGGGNAGECFEVLVRGLEIATLVFMHYRVAPDGKLKEMPMKIVDTGYGLERIYWLCTGKPNVYEAAFERVIADLRGLLGLEKPDYELLARLVVTMSQMSSEELSRSDIYDVLAGKLGLDAGQLRKLMLQQEFLYIVADHTRSLAWMVYDGVLPSNSGIGYLARLLLRRMLKYVHLLNIEVPLSELCARCVRFLVDEYPELKEVERTLIEIADLEERKFRETVSTAKGQVAKIVRKGKKSALSTDDLIMLYDAYGVPPEIVEQICKELGVTVKIPQNFYALLVEKKQRETTGQEAEREKTFITIDYVKDLPKTQELFYEDPYIREFTARVLKVLDVEGKRYLVLDRTAFYPEGGGQPSDVGKLVSERGIECDVLYVFKVGNVIVHEVKCSGDVQEGEEVRGLIDWERRYSLMKMHTGTHILLQAIRRVLGPHIWQAGVQKDIPYSRLDVTHYKIPSEDEIRKIEELANSIIERDLPVETEFLVRTEAEAKYGVRIYQGGFIPSPTLRIVKILEPTGEPYDVQACAGTHVRRTSEVSMVKIIGVEKLQEGVIRFLFTTGRHVLEYLTMLEKSLQETARALGCSASEVPVKVRKLLDSLRETESYVRRLEKLVSSFLMEEANKNIVNVHDIVISFIVVEDVSDRLVQDVAKMFTKEGKRILVVMNKRGDVDLEVKMFTSSDIPKLLSLRDLVREICSNIEECRGGGGGTFAQISIRARVNLDDIKHRILETIRSHVS